MTSYQNTEQEIDSLPGIPPGWKRERLGDLGDVLGGLTYDPNDITTDGLLVLRSSNIKDRQLAFDDNVFVDPAKYKYNSVQEGDILICVRNGSRSLIGKNAIINEKAVGVAFGAFMAVFRSKHNRYLFQLFDTDFYAREIHRNLGATINSINGSDLREFRFPFPPPEEEIAIANLLSTWDRAIMLTTQLIAQKELRKKWLMRELLSGRRRLRGFVGAWKEGHLADYFTERDETGYDSLPLLSIGQEGVYPQADSVKKDTSNEDKSKYKRICPGDIGYNTMRMWQGRSALSALQGIVSPAYTIVTPSESADATYFSYLFKSPHLINSFFRNSQGLVEDTLNCKFKDFAIVKVKAPQKSEQIAIAIVLWSADSELALLNRKIDMLREQKKGLMQVLLTGKRRLSTDK